MKKYTTLRPIIVGNSHVSKGVEVELTDKQATFFLPGGYIELVPATDTKKPTVASKKTEKEVDK